MSQKTFASYAFGCRVNQAEKEVLDAKMLERGFSYDAEDPSVYLINTCAVTNKAEREARQLINQIKTKNPKTTIVVTGCAATKWIKENISIPNADMFIDNTNKEFAAQLIEKRMHPGPPPTRYLLTPPVAAVDKYLPSGRVLIKVQDGCHRFCTFCIVPYLRGLPTSKKIEDIIDLIHQKESQTAEVIFTAINTEAFGRDNGEHFNELIRQTIQRTRIPRISFGSIHPWSITDEFLKLYQSLLPYQRMVDFFHIPLQSGSNNMLKLMRRGYTREEFVEKLHRLAAINPFALISTDVIVGFLQETDADFEETYQFLKDSPISKFHIFRFSKRDQTAAYFMSKRMSEPPPEVKKERAYVLATLGKQKYYSFLEKHIGKISKALLLEKKEGGMQSGLLQNQLPIKLTHIGQAGSISLVHITDIQKGELVGTPVI